MDIKEPKTTEFNPKRFIDSLLEVSQQVVTSPRYFFHNLPRSSDIVNPFIFLLLCAFLAALFIATVKNGNLQIFFLLFFSNIISAFAGSLIFHLIALKIFKSNMPFGATFRILAYASIMDILSWIPILGIAAYFYGLYIVFIGLQEIHHLNSKNAGIAIFGVIVVITVLLALILSAVPEGLEESIKIIGNGS